MAPDRAGNAAVTWRRIDSGIGHSVASIAARADGWTAHGAEVLVGEDPIACWFRVELDAGWRTRWASVRSLSGAGERTLLLEATASGEWSADAGRRPDLDGCVDVDVAATPLTNTFPVRRLADLGPGEQRTSPTAWVDVPSLTVQRVDQTYERIDERSWRYSDPLHGAFRIDVDEAGVVTRYEGFAVRIP